SLRLRELAGEVTREQQQPAHRIPQPIPIIEQRISSFARLDQRAQERGLLEEFPDRITDLPFVTTLPHGLLVGGQHALQRFAQAFERQSYWPLLERPKTYRDVFTFGMARQFRTPLAAPLCENLQQPVTPMVWLGRFKLSHLLNIPVSIGWKTLCIVMQLQHQRSN